MAGIRKLNLKALGHPTRADDQTGLSSLPPVEVWTFLHPFHPCDFKLSLTSRLAAMKAMTLKIETLTHQKRSHGLASQLSLGFSVNLNVLRSVIRRRK